jgi:hypothetical protein
MSAIVAGSCDLTRLGRKHRCPGEIELLRAIGGTEMLNSSPTGRSAAQA